MANHDSISVRKQGAIHTTPLAFPSLLFVHNDHEFVITAVPDGTDVILHIADQYGRMLLPVSTRVVGANARLGRRPNHRSIGVAMAELRRSVERLAGEKFLNFLETPRAASDFRWTPAELEAAKNSTGLNRLRRLLTKDTISSSAPSSHQSGW
jgi:hypothetical protein